VSPEADKQVARAKHDALVAAVTRAIQDADPMGLLNLGAPTDEYSPEIGTIVPRLAAATEATDVFRVLREEFVRWFGADAGREEVYAEPARRIWEAVVEFRKAGQ
jgi:hypothetical protein